MLYERFEDLPVWQEAAHLYNRVLDLLLGSGANFGPAWKFQIERAALSVSNNISEGFERFTDNELRSYLSTARGSAGEVRSMVTLIATRPEHKSSLADLKEIRGLAESCTRQLGAWIQFKV
jgi:four helix bundle protein